MTSNNQGMDELPASSSKDGIAISQKDGFAIYKRLASYAIKHWRYLIIGILGLFITALTQPLFAAYMKPLLDGTFMEKDPETIKWAPIAIFGHFLSTRCIWLYVRLCDGLGRAFCC